MARGVERFLSALSLAASDSDSEPCIHQICKRVYCFVDNNLKESTAIKYSALLTAATPSQLAVMSSASNQPPHVSSDEYAASREDLELFRRLLRVARLIKANDFDNLGWY